MPEIKDIVTDERVLSGSPGRYGATRSRDFAPYENF